MSKVDEYDSPPGQGTRVSVENPHHTPIDDLEANELREKLNERAEMFPMRQVSIPFIKGSITFNPVTSLIGIVILWGLAIYCMAFPDESNTELGEWKSWTTMYFTWFYIGTQGFWFFFAVLLAIMFGNVKLGKKNEKPEFSDGTFFAMIFSCGVAVGLFFFGVSEPLYYLSSTRFANKEYMTQDEIAQSAMGLTITHWGFAAWGCYVVVALSVGLAAHRFGLPMTLRSTFYPLLGDFVWGWIGDVIDGISIVVVVSGVCTSLGLGATQIVAGLRRIDVLGPLAEGEDQSGVVAATIWVITGAATISVVSGLNKGIKTLSEVAFILGSALWFLVLVSDKTEHLLNLTVQSTGFYLQKGLFWLNFVTDAYGQLSVGEGRSTDGQSAPEWFMDAWTVFYYAWWTAWSSFVGLFVARISKGRTVREVVGYSLVGPTLYAILWFCVFGGAGLRSSRVADEIQLASKLIFNDTNYYKIDGKPCYNIPNETLSLDGKTLFVPHGQRINYACNIDGSEGSWFNLLESYDSGVVYSALSIICIAIYFVTSSDSGSLIVDHLASNGSEHHHTVQRIFWAFTEGAVATALLLSGGNNALRALQAASIVAGLPFTLLLVFMNISLWKFCKKAKQIDDGESDDSDEEHDFTTSIFGGVFNVFEFIFSAGRIHEERQKMGMGFPGPREIFEFFKGTGLPVVSYLQVRRKVYPALSDTPRNLIMTVIYGALFYGAFFLFFTAIAAPVVLPYAWVCFFGAACVLTVLRVTVRGRFAIDSNVFCDFCASLLLWGQVHTQLILQYEKMEEVVLQKDIDDEDDE